MEEKRADLLRAEGLSFSYGDRRVLHDVSFTLPQGEYLSIIGPNGSGKSTLFEILCGNARPERGQVIYKGRDVHTMDIRGRARHFAVIHQNEQVDFPYTCMEMVILGLHPHRARFERLGEEALYEVRRIMEKTDTLAFADKLITQLSGGERQRVALARALSQRPRILWMDEAMSDLDVSAKIQMIELLRNLTKEGLTVVGVNHDLNTAYRFSDRILALSHGSLYAMGAPDEVMNERLFEEVFGVRAEIYPGKGFFITGESVSRTAPAVF
ncbi:ABC transporter ATP-binding protein [Zongyangia hominis]|uniref:ABC transporter ATP-binding protein n=1 Tax=Zongyangia hominis TaxID=2763677 RepID=A0A926E8S7_9FIRM|nr:ABC transporter ATP-binding protein [Zongyangia hominis]MBC8569308.1 ABC transporter ATP-binding protein [Zongyangia hominis]